MTENLSKYTGKVNLVSYEGDKFEVDAKVAAMSELVKTMIQDNDDDEEEEEEEESEQEIPLFGIKSVVLAKVVQFCNYHVDKPMNKIDKAFTNIEEVVDNWDADFVNKLDPEMLFKLIYASYYMDIGSLKDLTCAKVASIIKKKLYNNDESYDITTQIEELPLKYFKIKILSFFTYEDIIKIKDDHWNHDNNIKKLKENIDINKYLGHGLIPIDCVDGARGRGMGLLLDATKQTINDAYEKIKQSNGVLTTIVLGEGEHVVGGVGRYLNIKDPVNIVGSRDVLDKSKIVVVGGFWIAANGVHVEHLTIRHKYGSGVFGKTSCTLTDLMIDQCGGHGVSAYGSDVVLNCTNIMVSKCINSGVCAQYGGTIILRGNRTQITDNCLSENSWDYGLAVQGPSSKIKIVKPQTKETISKGNKGGGDWGTNGGATLDQIENITQTQSQQLGSTTTIGNGETKIGGTRKNKRKKNRKRKSRRHSRKKPFSNKGKKNKRKTKRKRN